MDFGLSNQVGLVHWLGIDSGLVNPEEGLDQASSG